MLHLTDQFVNSRDSGEYGMKITRRRLAALLGLQTALAAAVPGVTAAATAPPSGAPADNASVPLSRGAFVALVADHFGWVHSSEYIDAFKAVQPTFVDVKLGLTAHARQIEAALEESIIDGADGYFHPDATITRAVALQICARAFGVAVETLAAGTAAAPAALLTGAEGRALLAGIAAARVAPPQVMCKSGTTAPRRYVRLSTPTPDAALRYTLTFDGSEPADPGTAAGQVYDFTADGVLQLVNPPDSTSDYRLYRLKAVATKPGLATSAVREFTWNIVRPQTGAFQAKLVHAGSGTAPRVWRIFNPAEFVQAINFYMEGTARGLLFDCAEYPRQKANLKAFVDTLARRPYDVVLGHSHPDHVEQIANFTSAGVGLYMSERERALLLASKRTDFQAAAAAARVLQDGQVLDLGNVQVTAWQIPGHTDGLTTIIVNQTGWVYGSDMWGCNRPYTADTTTYQGVKVDLFLSLVQQLLVNYRRSSANGEVNELTNAHQETAVGRECIRNFEKCFQQIIDAGNAVTRPSIRGGTKVGDRMSMVGDMWRDRNWMAIGPMGKYAAPVDYLTRPTTAWPCGATLDYNTPDGYLKYSVLSNLEIEGGTLVGVDVHWNAPANGVPNRMSNKFDPWTYRYTVRVPSGTRGIVIRPTAMSSNARSVEVNGTKAARGAGVPVAVAPGSRVSVAVVSPDGSSSSRYELTIAT
jgi:hypothetical protein